MQQIARLSLMLGLAGLLQACQLAAPGGSAVTANAITGDAIEVTALDAPAAPAGAPPPLAPATAGAQTAAPASAGDAAETGSTPAPIPDATAATGQLEAAAEGAPDVVPEAAPEVVPEPKSAQQQACERKRGKWVRAVGELKACVYPTKDAGKHCTRESQCDGACLARSNTCAPVKPLFGCNDILQDDGARVSLCIE